MGEGDDTTAPNEDNSEDGCKSMPSHPSTVRALVAGALGIHASHSIAREALFTLINERSSKVSDFLKEHNGEEKSDKWVLKINEMNVHRFSGLVRKLTQA